MERYEAYKDSGIEWIGEIPERWTADKVVRLFAVIGSGTTPRTDVEAYYDGDIPWVQSGDLGEWMITGTSKTVTEDAIRNTSALVLYEAPFIAIAMYGASIGNMSIIEVDSCVNQACCVLSNCKAVMRYYAYALDSAKRYLIDHGIGGTQPNISQQVIRGLWLPQPSIHEQRAIADYLDAKTAEIDALVADCEREVGLLREYRKAVISEAVTKGLDPEAPMRDSGVEWIGEIPEGWEVRPFKAVARVVANLQHPEDYPRLPQVSPDRIEKETGRLLPCLTVEEVGVESDNHLFIQGDILYSKVRPALNKVTVAPYDGMCSADMYPITTTHNRRWLMYYMLSDAFMEQVIVSTDRVKMPKINKDELGVFLVVLPKAQAQEAIVGYLDTKTTEIDSLIEAKQSMADKLQEYRRSLISEAVTGKFKVPGV